MRHATSLLRSPRAKKCLNHFITSSLYSKIKSEGRDSPVYCRNWIHRRLQHTVDHHRPTSIHRLHSIHLCYHMFFAMFCIVVGTWENVFSCFVLSSHLQGRLDAVARHGSSITGLGTKGVLAPTGPLTIHGARLFIATLLLKQSSKSVDSSCVFCFLRPCEDEIRTRKMSQNDLFDLVTHDIT